jgi:sugar lactone lactonase YvrE
MCPEEVALMRRLISAFSMAVVLTVAALPAAATADSFPDLIVVTGLTSAEGIATGSGSSFYVGDFFLGDIHRGDLRSGSTALFRDAPTGRMAVGMKVDVARDLLFVAGGFTGQAYVYDASTGADVAVLQLGAPGPGTMINDVALAKDAAWFTNAFSPLLYRVPIATDGSIGTPSTLTVTGPAANLSGPFNMNGIAATPDAKTLIVAHSSDATVYTVDPDTGASAAIAGAIVPNVDGILLEAGRLWVVQNFANRVTELRLNPDLTSATVEQVITNSDFQVPTTVARHGNRLALVNAKFDTGIPPTAPTYEVVIVER